MEHPNRNIELKIDPDSFNAVVENRMSCNVRFLDKTYAVGDTLLLTETEHSYPAMLHGAPLKYTGRKVERTISHIMRGPAYGIASGWALLSFEPAVPKLGRIDDIVAGALFDFIGMLTTQRETTVMSSHNDAQPAVRMLQRFAEKRSLKLNEPLVRMWASLLNKQIDSTYYPDPVWAKQVEEIRGEEPKVKAMSQVQAEPKLEPWAGLAKGEARTGVEPPDKRIPSDADIMWILGTYASCRKDVRETHAELITPDNLVKGVREILKRFGS